MGVFVKIFLPPLVHLLPPSESLPSVSVKEKSASHSAGPPITAPLIAAEQHDRMGSAVAPPLLRHCHQPDATSLTVELEKLLQVHIVITDSWNVCQNNNLSSSAALT